MSKTRSKKSERVTLVLATLQPYTRHNIPHYEVASYTCECGHKGAVHAGLDTPHCAKCGTGVTAKQVTNASVTRIEQATSSVSLLCPDCDTHNLMATASAIEFNGSVHCASCGENLEYDVADVQESDEDEMDDSEVDLDNDTGSDDLTDSIDEDDDGDNDEDDAEEASLDDDDVDIEDLVEDADTDEDDEDVTDADDYLGGDVADDADESDEDEEDLEDETVISKVKPTAVASLLSDKTLAKVRIVPEADRIHLFAKNTCVATLKATPDNVAVFGKKPHLQMIQASLNEAGYSKTVDKFGFALATVRMSKDKALESTVASIQSKAQARVADKVKAAQESIRQSLEIAAVGFNRDAFASTMSNPLKDGFHDMLVGMGIDSVTASIQVQQVFANVGDAYSEALLNKANEIASYAPDVRVQLASTFASMTPPTPNLVVQTHASVDEDEDLDDSDSYFADDEEGCNSVTARLENPMRASTSASVQTQTRGTSMFARHTIR